MTNGTICLCEIGEICTTADAFRLRQKGLLASLRRRWGFGEWEAGKMSLESSQLLEGKSLDISQLLPVFLGGASVVVLCLVIMGMEFLFYYHTRSEYSPSLFSLK